MKERELPRGAVISIEQCWRLAQDWYRGRLDAAWRKRTAAETAAVFEAVGLRGEFWAV